MRSTTQSRSCAFSASSRSSGLRFTDSSGGTKVCTFEPSFGCQARSSPSCRLSTSSLLFDRDILSPVDRDILFMIPPNIPNHRLDGTVARCEGESTHTPGHSSALANVIHRYHIPYLTTPPSLMLICTVINGCPRARNNALHLPRNKRFAATT